MGHVEAGVRAEKQTRTGRTLYGVLRQKKWTVEFAKQGTMASDAGSNDGSNLEDWTLKFRRLKGAMQRLYGKSGRHSDHQRWLGRPGSMGRLSRSPVPLTSKILRSYLVPRIPRRADADMEPEAAQLIYGYHHKQSRHI